MNRKINSPILSVSMSWVELLNYFFHEIINGQIKQMDPVFQYEEGLMWTQSGDQSPVIRLFWAKLMMKANENNGYGLGVHTGHRNNQLEEGKNDSESAKLVNWNFVLFPFRI